MSLEEVAHVCSQLRSLVRSSIVDNTTLEALSDPGALIDVGDVRLRATSTLAALDVVLEGFDSFPLPQAMLRRVQLLPVDWSDVTERLAALAVARDDAGVQALLLSLLRAPAFAALRDSLCSELRDSVRKVLAAPAPAQAAATDSPCRSADSTDGQQPERRKGKSTDKHSTVLAFDDFPYLSGGPSLTELQPILDRMAQTDVSARLAAYEAALAYAPCDVLHCQYYAPVKRAMLGAAGDADPRLQALGVRYLGRLFREAVDVSPVQACELCSDFVRVCIETHCDVTVSSISVITTSSATQGLLRRFRLLLQMLSALTPTWVYVPEPEVDRLLVSLFVLLQLRNASSPSLLLTPFVLLSLAASCTPPTHHASEAESGLGGFWFWLWCLAAKPRGQMMLLLAQSGLLSQVMEALLPGAPSPSASHTHPLHREYHAHSLALLCCVLHFAEGRALFPLSVPVRAPRPLPSLAHEIAASLASVDGGCIPDPTCNNRLRCMAVPLPPSVSGNAPALSPSPSPVLRLFTLDDTAAVLFQPLAMSHPDSSLQNAQFASRALCSLVTSDTLAHPTLSLLQANCVTAFRRATATWDIEPSAELLCELAAAVHLRLHTHLPEASIRDARTVTATATATDIATATVTAAAAAANTAAALAWLDTFLCGSLSPFFHVCTSLTPSRHCISARTGMEPSEPESESDGGAPAAPAEVSVSTHPCAHGDTSSHSRSNCFCCAHASLAPVLSCTFTVLEECPALWFAVVKEKSAGGSPNPAPSALSGLAGLARLLFLWKSIDALRLSDIGPATVSASAVGAPVASSTVPGSPCASVSACVDMCLRGVATLVCSPLGYLWAQSEGVVPLIASVPGLCESFQRLGGPCLPALFCQSPEAGAVYLSGAHFPTLIQRLTGLFESPTLCIDLHGPDCESAELCAVLWPLEQLMQCEGFVQQLVSAVPGTALGALAAVIRSHFQPSEHTVMMPEELCVVCHKLLSAAAVNLRSVLLLNRSWGMRSHLQQLVQWCAPVAPLLPADLRADLPTGFQFVPAVSLAPASEGAAVVSGATAAARTGGAAPAATAPVSLSRVLLNRLWTSLSTMGGPSERQFAAPLSLDRIDAILIDGKLGYSPGAAFSESVLPPAPAYPRIKISTAVLNLCSPDTLLEHLSVLACSARSNIASYRVAFTAVVSELCPVSPTPLAAPPSRTATAAGDSAEFAACTLRYRDSLMTVYAKFNAVGFIDGLAGVSADDITAVCQSDEGQTLDTMSVCVLLLCAEADSVQRFRRLACAPSPLAQVWVAQHQARSLAVHASVSSCVEWLVQHVQPSTVHNAKRCGLSIPQLVLLWLRQGFWNVLDFADISLGVLLLPAVCGPQWLVYFLAHLVCGLGPVYAESAAQLHSPAVVCAACCNGVGVVDWTAASTTMRHLHARYDAIVCKMIDCP